MTTVEVDENGANGLTAVVVAVVEILVDALEREAIRRMESGRLSDEEVERLGSHLATLEADIERLKDEQGVDEQVDQLRGDLDSLVADAVQQVDREERGRTSVDDAHGADDRENSTLGGPDERR